MLSSFLTSDHFLAIMQASLLQTIKIKNNNYALNRIFLAFRNVFPKQLGLIQKNAAFRNIFSSLQKERPILCVERTQYRQHSPLLIRTPGLITSERITSHTAVKLEGLARAYQQAADLCWTFIRSHTAGDIHISNSQIHLRPQYFK